VAFLFPGQGNLHAFAGFGLYEHDALFRECLDEVARVLLANGGPNILEIMRRNAADAGASSLASTAMAQPLLFGLETAFARALAAKGVRPDCVLGHSLGEYAAAVQAGIFSWRTEPGWSSAGPL
jgi:acyl transferase domain-containing protein